MRWRARSSVGFCVTVLFASACSSELQICEPGARWSHDLAACVADGDDGLGMRDDSVTTPDTGVPDPGVDRDAAPEDGGGVLSDAEVSQDAAVSHDAAVVDAAPAEPDAGRGDAAVQEPDAASGTCKDGETQERACGLNDRGQLVLECSAGEWLEGTCADPDECVDGAVETVECDRRRPGRKRCVEGHWREASCMMPDDALDAGEAE